MSLAVSSPSRSLSRAELVANYDGRAPRYTSYPTALQFKPDIGAERYRAWLAELPPAAAVSLYLHIPFCARLCWYCGCNTRGVTRHEPIGEYVELLLAELALLRQALPGRLPAQALHFGGGTPNMLTPEELTHIVGALREAFDVEAGWAFAAELDPAVLSRDWVRAATRLGLNRASLGVQNLDREVQRAVNRRESVEEIAACVAWLREGGVTSVNLDLMYGLPRQTVANTLATIDALARIRPERIALFGYAHVPWMKAHQKLIRDDELPGAEGRLEQSEAAAERLQAEGYVRIGLDHFALSGDELAVALREGRLHRNFQGYTADGAAPILGLGASAIGSLAQGFVQNQTQEVAWRAAVAAGELPVARGLALSEEDRFRGEIIERLMCDLAVDLAAICAAHGRSMGELEPARLRLAPFVADGLLTDDGGRLRVLADGRLVIRSICAAFDGYFQPDGGRHSKAI